MSGEVTVSRHRQTAPVGPVRANRDSCTAANACYSINLVGAHRQRLCVPKTLFVLMEQWNHLSWRNDRAALFRFGRAGLAIQVEVTA